MKKSLNNAMKKTQELWIEATIDSAYNGHLLLRDCPHKYGYEDHIWVNNRSIAHLTQFKFGDRIKFMACLRKYKKKDGSISIRVEDLREIRRLD